MLQLEWKLQGARLDNMTDMTGKVALVTGAGSGIGRCVAKIFAKRGAAVVIADINVEAGTNAVEEIRAAGGRSHFVRTDVSSEADSRALVEAAVSTYGRLDYAVNNAGYDGDVRPLTEQSGDVFRRVVDVNLLGVFFGLKYQIPVMVKQGGGAIVNTSSIAGVRGHPGIGPYVAAKHGVNGLTKTAAIEYGPSKIRVNSLCPGGVRTPLLEHYLQSAPELRASIIDANPLRRLGEPEEMAEAAVWLCSAAASYVNGIELVADGGKIVSDV
jgi:NAD(P)-dependent dehydrogenase (short-subunit alcohol dehydrogenase family)